MCVVFGIFFFNKFNLEKNMITVYAIWTNFFQALPSKLTSSKPNFFTPFPTHMCHFNLLFPNLTIFTPFPYPLTYGYEKTILHVLLHVHVIIYFIHNMKKHNFEIWNKLLGIVWRNEKKKGVGSRGMHVGFCWVWKSITLVNILS